MPPISRNQYYIVTYFESPILDCHHYHCSLQDRYIFKDCRCWFLRPFEFQSKFYTIFGRYVYHIRVRPFLYVNISSLTSFGRDVRPNDIMKSLVNHVDHIGSTGSGHMICMWSREWSSTVKQQITLIRLVIECVLYRLHDCVLHILNFKYHNQPRNIIQRPPRSEFKYSKTLYI